MVADTPSAPVVPAGTTMAIGSAAITSARDTQRSIRADPPAPLLPGLADVACATSPDPPLEPLGMQMMRARLKAGSSATVAQMVVPTGKLPAVVDS
jgi:hypothetical protein